MFPHPAAPVSVGPNGPVADSGGKGSCRRRWSGYWRSSALYWVFCSTGGLRPRALRPDREKLLPRRPEPAGLGLRPGGDRRLVLRLDVFRSSRADPRRRVSGGHAGPWRRSRSRWAAVHRVLKAPVDAGQALRLRHQPPKMLGEYFGSENAAPPRARHRRRLRGTFRRHAAGRRRGVSLATRFRRCHRPVVGHVDHHGGRVTYVCFGGLRAAAYVGALQALLLGAGIVGLGRGLLASRRLRVVQRRSRSDERGWGRRAGKRVQRAVLVLRGPGSHPVHGRPRPGKTRTAGSGPA